MGCWDIFCFICDNPCHQFLIELNYKKLDNKAKFKLKNLSFFGEASRNPIFIKNLKWKKNNIILNKISFKNYNVL